MRVFVCPSCTVLVSCAVKCTGHLNTIRSGGVSMRRNYWVVVANVVCAVAIVGCHDASLVEPTSAASSSPAAISLAPEGRPTFDISADIGGSSSVDFVVGPDGGTFAIGGNAVFFPAQSICDPATSSYGPGKWDAACSKLKSNIQIHAELRSLDGRTWVDFSPALRFVPSPNPNRWVYVMINTPAAQGASEFDLDQFNILYASSIGGALEDDAATDATMRTYVDTDRGISIRRVKHFSGYTASAGYYCDPRLSDCTAPPETAPAAP